MELNKNTRQKQTLINESAIDDVFKSIYTTIISNIQKLLGEGSDWVIDSVIDHNINIWKYNPLAGSSYTKLPKELDHPIKGLINILNIDKDCFKWRFVRYVHSADHHSARITKAEEDFAKKINFKDTKLTVKVKEI